MTLSAAEDTNHFSEIATYLTLPFSHSCRLMPLCIVLVHVLARLCAPVARLLVASVAFGMDLYVV